MTSLVKDLSDGVRLIQLMVNEAVFGDSLMRWELTRILALGDHG